MDTITLKLLLMVAASMRVYQRKIATVASNCCILLLWGKPVGIDTFIHRLQAGEPKAFAELMAEYRHKVYNTAISLVQDAESAQELTQDVFITVYRTVHGFKGNSSLSTWIYRITVNKCLDSLRATQRSRKSGIFSFDPSTATGYAGFDHPGIRAERKEQARFLFEAIRKLPQQQQTAFVLAHMEELPQKEIAAIMKLSLKAVESLLQRAKGNLRNYLAEVYDRRIDKNKASKQRI